MVSLTGWHHAHCDMVEGNDSWNCQMQASVGLPMPAFQAALAVPLPHFDSPPPSSQPAPVSQTTPIYHPSSNTLSASSTQPKSMTETAPISQPGESASQPLTDAQPAEPVQPTTFEQSALAGERCSALHHCLNWYGSLVKHESYRLHSFAVVAAHC